MPQEAARDIIAEVSAAEAAGGAYPPEFLEMLKPGATLRLDYGPESIVNRTIHVRAIVDDIQVVYRHWQGPVKGWCYTIESRYSLFFLWRYGVLQRPARKRKAPANA
jgi:hypothetical protein